MLRKLTSVSEALGQEAYNLGSADNITVMIVLLLPTRSATEESCEPIKYPPCPPLSKTMRASASLSNGIDAKSDRDRVKSVGDTASVSKSSDPLSPSALTKEILNLLDDTMESDRAGGAPRGGTLPTSLRSEFASVAQRLSDSKGNGETASASLSKRGPSAEDEMMQFLLDDANF